MYSLPLLHTEVEHCWRKTDDAGWSHHTFNNLTSQTGTRIFLAAILLHKSMLSHSSKLIFSLPLKPPIPPLLILPLNSWPCLTLYWGNRSNQIKTSSSLSSADLEPSCIRIYILSGFVLLLWVECLCSYPKLTNLRTFALDSIPCFSKMLLLQLSPFLLYHWFLPLFWIIPTCIQTFSGISSAASIFFCSYSQHKFLSCP